jgi:RNA polymerase sigma-70 factor (ECF subfamily)
MYDPLSAYARNILINSQLAEEAVQETFSIVCAKADDLFESKNPKGWLVTTLKNVIKNMNRNKADISRLIINDDRFSNSRTVDDNIDLLYSGLDKNADYQLLKRIALDRYTMLEAAQELGISVEACKKRVQRAKKRLKKYFKK